MDGQIVYSVFQEKSIFMPLRYLYPECMELIAKHDQLYPLRCLVDGCPVNKNCMDILAKRVNYIFTNLVPKGELLVAYFKYKDRPQSIRAGIFERDLNEPYTITLNQAAFKKFQKEGVAYVWVPPSDFLFPISRGNQIIIPAESLIKPRGF